MPAFDRVIATAGGDDAVQACGIPKIFMLEAGGIWAGIQGDGRKNAVLEIWLKARVRSEKEPELVAEVDENFG